jgi:hypothetical protein
MRVPPPGRWCPGGRAWLARVRGPCLAIFCRLAGSAARPPRRPARRALVPGARRGRDAAGAPRIARGGSASSWWAPVGTVRPSSTPTSPAARSVSRASTAWCHFAWSATATSGGSSASRLGRCSTPGPAAAINGGAPASCHGVEWTGLFAGPGRSAAQARVQMRHAHARARPESHARVSASCVRGSCASRPTAGLSVADRGSAD